GTLLNAMTVFTDITKPTTAAKIAVLRSSDKGVTWPDPPVTVNVVANLPIVDPKTRVGVRSGGALPSIAVDASTGKVYVVWQDSRFTGLRNGVALATSTDGGLTWSPLVQVNSVPGTNAFTPAISAGGGRIAVSYYDFRFDVPSDSSQLQVNSWLATSTDDGATWQETALAGPFNLYTAPVAEGFFLGDYQGAAWDGAAFLSFFSATNSGNLADRTSLQFRRVEPGAPAAMHAWLDRIRPDRWLRSWLRPSERAGRPAAARTAR
ncbi:MAG TPA: sialidase family protein, partial [Myxococcales bacterium]|nr:sialidase family protein [Myxococcales bacterium]